MILVSITWCSGVGQAAFFEQPLDLINSVVHAAMGIEAKFPRGLDRAHAVIPMILKLLRRALDIETGERFSDSISNFGDGEILRTQVVDAGRSILQIVHNSLRSIANMKQRPVLISTKHGDPVVSVRAQSQGVHDEIESDSGIGVRDTKESAETKSNSVLVVAQEKSLQQV